MSNPMMHLITRVRKPNKSEIENDRRHFRGVLDYVLNLHGKILTVDDEEWMLCEVRWLSDDKTLYKTHIILERRSPNAEIKIENITTCIPIYRRHKGLFSELLTDMGLQETTK